jgi:low temperature requirement protein LtrA
MRIAVSRSPNAERVVTPLELFFDLVYVFAIGQLSHHLLEHVDLRAGAETVILALAVFYAWYMTAWGANWLEPDRLPVQLLLVGLMFASLLMSVAIAEAFGGRAWLFVAAYLLLQVGRAAFLIVALRGRALGGHFVNVLVWELIAGGLWVAGAIAEGTRASRFGGLRWWSPMAARGSCTGCLAVANASVSGKPTSRASTLSSASGCSSLSCWARVC